MDKKYELTDSKEYRGFKLYRIKALKDFGNIKAGDFGGYVEHESNLEHYGDCWIEDEAMVYQNAIISGNATIGHFAEVIENAKVFGDSKIIGESLISGNAIIHGNSIIKDMAIVSGDSNISNSVISGTTNINGQIQINDSVITGDSFVCDLNRIKDSYIENSIIKDCDIIGSKLEGIDTGTLKPEQISSNADKGSFKIVDNIKKFRKLTLISK